MKYLKLFEQFINEAKRDIVIGSVIPVKKYIPTKNSYELVDVRITDYIKKPGSKDFVEYELKGNKHKVAINVFKGMMESAITDNEITGKYDSFEVNEADLNDPVLMAFRAAKMKREKELAKPKRKPLYGKQREKAEDDLWVISQDLKDLYADRGQMLIDMEQEAEVEGGPIADEYGDKLNKIEDEIQKLISKRNKLEIMLAEGYSVEESAVTEAKITDNEITGKIEEFYNLQQQIELLKAELKEKEEAFGQFKDQITPMIDDMKELGDKLAETEGYVVKVSRFGGDRETVSWKDAFTLALGKVNAATQKVLNEAVESSKRVSKIGHSFKIEQVIEEASILDKVKKMFSSVIDKFSKIFKKESKEVEKANSELEKVTKGI